MEFTPCGGNANRNGSFSAELSCKVVDIFVIFSCPSALHLASFESENPESDIEREQYKSLK